jgi:hypothetical protein
MSAMTLCSCQMIVSGGVTFPFTLLFQRKRYFQKFRNLLSSLTAVELPGNTLVTLEVLPIQLHVLNHGVSMALVLCYTVKMHHVLNTQQGFCMKGILLLTERFERVTTITGSIKRPSPFISISLH